MTEHVPDRRTGTERGRVAEVPGAGDRWEQVHFNKDIPRQFFNLQPGMDRSITIERVSAAGRVVERTSRQLVFPESNRNSRIELFFGPRAEYPPLPHRPLV